MSSPHMPVTNRLTSDSLSFMKTPSSKYYTDPIVYREGFFKDPQEEQAYMERISRQCDVQERRLQKKGAISGKSPRKITVQSKILQKQS